MSIDHSTLTKGQIRKLNALRKSVGNDIAEDAFTKCPSGDFMCRMNRLSGAPS